VEGLDLIAAALAAGATAGVTGTANTAVTDAYSSLKKLIERRLGGHRPLPENITHAAEWKAKIGNELVAAGADTDAEIIGAARRLRGLARTAVQINATTMNGTVFGDHAQQHNTFGG
jgi:hypothetical protein